MRISIKLVYGCLQYTLAYPRSRDQL